LSSLINKAKEVILQEAESLREMAEHLDENFENAVNLIFDAKGKVLIFGMGKSGQIGRKIAATLSSTGTPAFFVHPAEGIHGDLGVVLSGDVAILISKSGDTEELFRLIPILKRLEVPIIALTGGNGSPLSKEANVVLDTSVSSEAGPLEFVPTTSATAALVMGDALAAALVELRGFSADDFSLIHPGGALGRRLIKVRDLMHTGYKIPIVKHDADFKDVLLEMTSKRFGMTFIVDDDGKIMGIFTDGDLRRIMSANENPMMLKAKEVAQEDPKRIKVDDLAATAIAVMEEHSITSLIITDESNKPMGIIHLHDILKAKVV